MLIIRKLNQEIRKLLKLKNILGYFQNISNTPSLDEAKKNATEQTGSPDRSQRSYGSNTRFGGTEDPKKQESGHHWRKIKVTETRLNQISRTNTKAVAR